MLADLNTLAERGATVVGPQEASDRGPVLDAFLNTHSSWGAYRPTVSGGPAVPILWDGAVWEYVRSRSVRAVGRRRVVIAGRLRWSKVKRINIVTLRHRETGEVRDFLCTHMIPSATRRGDEYDRNRAHYRDHIAALVPLLTPGCVLMWDANAEPDFRLLAPVRSTFDGVDVRGWTTEPTHDDRAIDHVLGPDGKRVVVPLSSDHHAVMAEL